MYSFPSKNLEGKHYKYEKCSYGTKIDFNNGVFFF